MDIRVGIDGLTTYESAGDAVRDQIKKYRDIHVGSDDPPNYAKAWIDTTDSDEVINIPEINDASISEVDTWSSKRIQEDISGVAAGRISFPDDSAFMNGYLRDVLAECQWERGGLDVYTGEAIENDYEFRSRNMITLPDTIVYNCSSTKCIGILAYSDDGTFVKAAHILTSPGTTKIDDTKKYRIVISDKSSDASIIVNPSVFIRQSKLSVWSNQNPYMLPSVDNELVEFDFLMNHIYDDTGEPTSCDCGICTTGYVPTRHRLIYIPDGVNLKVSIFDSGGLFKDEVVHKNPFVFVPNGDDSYQFSIYWDEDVQISEWITCNKYYYLAKTPIVFFKTDFGIVDMVSEMIKQSMGSPEESPEDNSE